MTDSANRDPHERLVYCGGTALWTRDNACDKCGYPVEGTSNRCRRLWPITGRPGQEPQRYDYPEHVTGKPGQR